MDGIFLTNLGKKMLAAELICWQSLLLCCSLPMAIYCSHTKPFKNVSSNISILIKGRAKKCPAQVRRCFMGNDQKKKIIEIDFHLLFLLNLLSHKHSLHKQISFGEYTGYQFGMTLRRLLAGIQ